LKVSTFDGEWLDAGTFDSLLEAGNIVKNKSLYKKFHPIIEKAIKEFNEELKILAKKKLT
jgi:NDP-sugar pyrophosphorylase family protein